MKVKRLKRAGLLKTPTKPSFSVSINELISRILKVRRGAFLISPNNPQPLWQPRKAAPSAGKMSRGNEKETAACHQSHGSIVCDHDQMPLMCVN